MSQTVQFHKESPSKYRCHFTLTSQQNINDLLTFDLFQTLLTINSTLFDASPEIHIVNENERMITAVFKHLFEKWGLPQKYLCMSVSRNTTTFDDNTPGVVFTATRCVPSTPSAFSTYSPALVNTVQCWCRVISPTTAEIDYYISMDETIPPFIEDVIKKVLQKVFQRLQMHIKGPPNGGPASSVGQT